MRDVTETVQCLDQLVVGNDQHRFPIRWSNAQIRSQQDIAGGIVAGNSAIDPPLAVAILDCVEGNFSDGAEKIVSVLRDHAPLIASDNESFISALFALYVAQQFPLLASLLRNRFEFRSQLAIAVEESGPGETCIRWEITEEGAHCFTFDACTYTYDKTRNDIISFYWAFPLYAAFAASSYREHGSVIINQADRGSTPGLAWCESRPDYFLIPDYIFIPSRGYAHTRQILDQNIIPWSERTSVAFWRGGTTGLPRTPGDWRTLERTALCELARRHDGLGLLDVGFSSILQMPSPEVVEEIRTSGLMRDFVPWADWGKFKFLIDIDGNSSPWSNLFQRLLTGSAVLKVESSRGLQQWYYDRLRPWENYIPIAPDMSDLVDKVVWLRRNDGVAHIIGQNGRELALSMTYEREIGDGIHTIASCFKYFRAAGGLVGPFGRAVAGRVG